MVARVTTTVWSSIGCRGRSVEPAAGAEEAEGAPQRKRPPAPTVMVTALRAPSKRSNTRPNKRVASATLS